VVYCQAVTDAPQQATIKVLLVEDDTRLAQLTARYLENHGVVVTIAGDGIEGQAEALRRQYDCIVLDLMLPGRDGIEVTRELRARTDVPIVMVTARGEEADRVLGLEVGADDYMTKPFSVGELLARVKALLPRSTQYAPEVEAVKVGRATVDVRHFSVRRGDREEALSHYEVELFKLLYANADQPVSRDEILEKIWGTENYPTNRTVDNFIVKLRKKIEEDYRRPKHILTIYGTGYKLSP